MTSITVDSLREAEADEKKASLQLALDISELRYRRLFETAQDGILILDGESGKIIDANPFVLDLLDYPFESIIGLELWEIGFFEDIAANKAAFDTLQTEEYVRYENHPLRNRAGKVIPVEFVSNVYLVGTERVIQCNVRDISERRAAEVTAEGRMAALQLSGDAKDHVIGVLSHELRTPLNAISTMLDVVELEERLTAETGASNKMSEFGQTALNVIRRNVQTLTRLITELLDLTHLAKGTLELNLIKVDAHELIGLVLKNFESERKAKHISIDVRLLARQKEIRADAGKVEQILVNLIGNALKFTGEGGRVSVVTRNEGAETLAVEVSDSGIGISPDALGRIFAPFAQADETIHSRFGGLGLGLSIAHSLAKAHGGTLQASSEGVGAGSKFTAHFALATEAAAAPLEPGAAREAAGVNVGRLLILDDDDTARASLVASLRALDYDVQETGDAATALQLAGRHSFDVFVAHVGVPGVNGLGLLGQMRNWSPLLHGIALSAHSLAADMARSKTAGFAAHLATPVKFAHLREALERLVPQARAASLRRMRE